MTIDELMDRARAVAEESPNRVRKVGCAMRAANGETLSGSNTFPRGVRDTEERHAGDGRFIWMEHAERGVLLAAARRGLCTEGATMATTLYPCIDCARAIVGAGVTHLITPEPDFSEPSWGEAFRISRVILDEGGVRFTAHASATLAPLAPVAPAPKLYDLR
ncbi:MAG: hypothetical protein BGP06_02630 [Rhizobiales bacterium 65-9]|nr:CMP deaminase [Hyphomicrobiales bacterium]OJY34362.1 MAG: hypothetical protein BGP06_02630 [Rhizobiales bacterium 65-9]